MRDNTVLKYTLAYAVILLTTTSLSYFFVSLGYDNIPDTKFISAPSVSVVSQVEENNGHGIWKRDKTGAYNYFCSNDGSYQAHVNYIEDGYWNTYVGDKQKTTFIDLSSAKRYIEKHVADCK